MTSTQLLIGYFGFINLLTFFVFGFDKWMARGGHWRTTERMLWLLAFLGGSPAALFGMQFFRHKTQKVSFQLILAFIIILQVGLLLGAYQLFSKSDLSATL